MKLLNEFYKIEVLGAVYEELEDMIGLIYKIMEKMSIKELQEFRDFQDLKGWHDVKRNKLQKR